MSCVRPHHCVETLIRSIDHFALSFKTFIAISALVTTQLRLLSDVARYMHADVAGFRCSRISLQACNYNRIRLGRHWYSCYELVKEVYTDCLHVGPKRVYHKIGLLLGICHDNR